MNQLVRFRPEIGRSPIILREYPEGTSLLDMARDVRNKLPPEFWTHGIAQVGPNPRNIVLPEDWRRVRPFRGTRVNFAVAPGDDEAFSTILQVAIIGTQLFSNLIPGIGPLLSAAIGIGGSFALAALAPKQKKEKGSGAGSPAQISQAGFASNALSPYEQVPRVLGRKRVAAPHLAPPYVEIVGENAFARCCIGLAGRHEVSDLRINGITASASPQTTPVIRTGLPSDGPLSLYNKVVWQEQGKRLMEFDLQQDVTTDQRWKMANQASASLAFTSRNEPSKFRLGKIRPDRLIIDLLWDQGLAQSKTDAKAGVGFILSFNHPTKSTIYLPEIHLSVNYRGPLRTKITIEFGPDPGGLTAPSASSGWIAAYTNTANAPTPTYYGAVANAAASHVGVDGNNLIIYVDPASIDITPDYEFRIWRSPAYLPARYNYTNHTYQFNGGGASDALVWSISVIGSTYYAIEDQALFYSTCTAEFVSRVWDTDPLDPTGLTTIEISIRNQTIDSITFVAGGYVKWKWDSVSATWTNEPHVSENPAEQAYDILRNDDAVLNSRPLSTALIDDAAHGEWAAFCKANDKRCNAIVESGSVEDALDLCYQAGHAKLTRSRKWKPWIEQDRSNEAPIKIYGPRDFWNWTIEKTFERKPHALRTTFDNQLYDWITEPERLVYATGYDVDNATLFEAVDYRSIDTDYNVDKRARLDLAIMRLRAQTYSFEARNRWLATPRGSLVGVNHPILHFRHVTAGVRKVIYDDPDVKGFIMGLILDGEIDMVPGTTGIAISSLNAEVFVLQSLDSGPTRQVMFTAPLANDAGIDEGAMIAAGVAGTEYIRCYVDDIKPGPRGSAKLILVDEAPEIHGSLIGDMYQVPDVYDLDDVYAVG